MSQELQYELSIQSLTVDGHEDDYGPTSIFKFADEDRFGFSSTKLKNLFGHHEFHSYNVEIIELVDRMMRFSLVQRGKDRQWHLNVIFSSNDNVQKFFRNVRLQKEQVQIFPTSSCSLNKFIDIGLTN